MAVEIVTFGCRLNAVESEAIRRAAAAAGVADAVIVNTCAVTAEAERQARQAIRRARRARPDATVIVTGCAAQIAPHAFAAMPEVDRVLGNREKLDADRYRDDARIDVGDRARLKESATPLVDGFEGRARGFVEVQQGCDHSCTFCIIPLGRGPSRSVPAGEVVRRAATLVDAGYAELVLTGVDLTAWGGDLPGRPALGQLCRRLLALVPGLRRLRLSSLDPAEIDPALWRLMASEKRLMPHLHLSVQAGDDLVLKRMKRRHSRGDVLDVAARARLLRPGIALGADLIAGFPTEDEAMFARTLALVDEAGLDYLHVFPFSPRPGTPAARMPQVPRPVVQARAAMLRAAGEAATARALASRIGSTADVLIEKDGFGRSEHYAPVRLYGTPGEIVRVRLAAGESGMLAGERT
ncbi:MAG TPA: tRNA (N(6)-L-threonylcarbamoyladenosine(37)-C(2))-methylthiotransferase MtaB [Stellaceae bacterium]|nr:tRNA (N(6)-L-threonylcarbamoyladenosine(37)-C(2))-methylthiotransferase MtaB [Stellaceae bacterium]